MRLVPLIPESEDSSVLAQALKSLEEFDEPELGIGQMLLHGVLEIPWKSGMPEKRGIEPPDEEPDAACFRKNRVIDFVGTLPQTCCDNVDDLLLSCVIVWTLWGRHDGGW